MTTLGWYYVNIDHDKEVISVTDKETEHTVEGCGPKYISSTGFQSSLDMVNKTAEELSKKWNYVCRTLEHE